MEPTVSWTYEYEEIDAITGEPVVMTNTEEWDDYWEEVTDEIGIYYYSSFDNMFKNN